MEKSLSFFGSFVLVTNNIVGPAMMGLPQMIAKSGLFPSVIVIIIVFLCSSISSTLLSSAISSIPGNKKFSRCIEYSTGYKVKELIKHFTTLVCIISIFYYILVYCG